MKLNNAKIIDITKEAIDLDDVIEFRDELYLLFSKDCISQQAYDEGYKLIVSVSEDRKTILKLLS